MASGDNMFFKFFQIDKLIDSVNHYFETKLDLFKIEAKEELISFASKFIYWLIIGIIGLFFILMISVSLGLYLGSILGNTFYGFLIISAFYFLLFLLLFLFREQLHLVDKIENLLNNALKNKGGSND